MQTSEDISTPEEVSQQRKVPSIDAMEKAETVAPLETKEYEEMKERVLSSPGRILENDIPGIFSSLMKYNAEKSAVPMTLNLVNKQTQKVYSSGIVSQENLVNNITITEEKNRAGGSFAQASKGIVAAGILLCIGMVSVLGAFFVKK